MSTTHRNSKLVYVRRLPSTVHEATNKDEQVKAYFDGAYKAIGSYWPKDSMRPGTGLNLAEENILMSYVLNIPITDRDFRQRATDFFHGITTKVDPVDPQGNGGTRLEIGLTGNNDEPISDTNLPLNLSDYIKYRHILSHPDVAASMELGKGNLLKKYVIFDPEVETKSKVTKASNHDDALAAYLEVKNNPVKVIQYLTLLNIDPMKYKGEETVKLKELAEKKPTEFLKVHDDKDKEYRYLVRDLVVANVLKSVGTRYMVVETNNQFAGSMEEAIAILKDPTESKQLLIFKGLVQDYKKKKNIPTGEKDVMNFTPIDLNKQSTDTVGAPTGNQLQGSEVDTTQTGSLGEL